MMTSLNYMAFIVPIFFAAVGIEAWILKRQGKVSYQDYGDLISNISIGLADRLMSLFVTGLFASTYYWIDAHWAIWEIGREPWIWVLLLLATDFVWYWYHRLGHEVNLLWAAHIVHHQSEQFNYTVSARITLIQSLVRHVFWCVLAVVGFEPGMIITMLTVHGAYSFFTHTRMTGRMKWLEYVFITPSLHGVHHASNPEYLDKNYGDIFVFWDKMFGTFQQETVEPVFGLTHPLRSHSFLWQHFHYFLELGEALRRAQGWRARMAMLFGKPAHVDPAIRPVLERLWLAARQPKPAPRGHYRRYVNAQILLGALSLFGFWLFFAHISLSSKVFFSLLFVLTLINCGALLEQRRWIFLAEYLRLLVLVAWIGWIWESVALGLLLTALVSAVWSMLPTKRWYYGLIYASA